MSAAIRGVVAAGVALLGSIAPAPAPAPAQPAMLPAIARTASGQSAAQDITIDFVRHAQTNPSGDVVAVATNGVPGFPLSALGEQQSVDVANKLFAELGGPNGVAGIFGGQEQRMIETAAPAPHPTAWATSATS